MELKDFTVGQTFWCAGDAHRCTDIGTRVIAAIRLDHDDDPSWYNGPPYAVAETVFDEYDQEGCEAILGEHDAELDAITVMKYQIEGNLGKSIFPKFDVNLPMPTNPRLTSGPDLGKSIFPVFDVNVPMPIIPDPPSPKFTSVPDMCLAARELFDMLDFPLGTVNVTFKKDEKREYFLVMYAAGVKSRIIGAPTTFKGLPVIYILRRSVWAF
jgi:hypothetical protein